MDVGYLDGGVVSPFSVGCEVVGFLEGAPVGVLVGREEEGRTVG
jgi:hypothetical protein